MRLTVIVCLLLLSSAVNSSGGYFRDPDLNGSTLVFTAEGDIWLNQLGSVEARRLTSHPAQEKEARLSPDARYLAFSASYNDSPEVYVMPLAGGVPRQVSFEQSQVRVLGWSPQGEVLYSTLSRIGPSWSWSMKLVNPESLAVRSVPLADAVEGAIDPAGEFIYFVQFGMQVSGDNVRVYRGGARGELWRYRLGSKSEAEQLTLDHPGSVRQPMVGNGRIYFVSDASGSDNIWSISKNARDFRQETHHTRFSVRGAQLDGERVAYQLGADIVLLNLNNGELESLELKPTSDYAQLRPRWLEKPLQYATGMQLAPAADKLVVTARGQVAIAGIDGSRLVKVQSPGDSRLRGATLSRDGNWVYAISDASGEQEVWRFAADGGAKRKQLTKGSGGFRYRLSESPDGRWLAHDDDKGVLWLTDVRTGRSRKVLENQRGFDAYEPVAWAPDSQSLAVAHWQRGEQRYRLVLASVTGKQTRLLTSDKYESYSPAFSPDGNWLYFLSNRQFEASPRSPWGDRNLGPLFDRRSQVFAIALNAAADFPFRSPNELMPAAPDKSAEEDGADAADVTIEPSPVEWKQLGEQLWQVPIPAGNYSQLAVNKSHLFVLDSINEADAKPAIKSVKLEPQVEVEVFAENVSDFQMSGNGKRLFVAFDNEDNSELYIVEAGDTIPEDTSKARVDAASWQLRVDPAIEWQQMFNDAWLMHRQMLFDPAMRGVDWSATREKYQPLLDRVTDRHELDDVFRQMMGELSVLHSQVGGGDYRRDERAPAVAHLGADFRAVKGGLIIDRRYRHDPELPELASPLLQPGVDAIEGDRIVALNGVEIVSVADLYRELSNQAGKQVLLQLDRGGSGISTVVVPVTARDASNMRYRDWVFGNTQRVARKHSEVGYLHLYSMVGDDAGTFAREFYANINKQGLIIDVRRNRGGNIDSWIIEKLLRQAWMFWARYNDARYTNMQQQFRGHLVVLADQMTYSDGETFTAAIKSLDLAPVIGKQTAGAGVWLTGRNRLADRGVARVAELPVFAMDGRWVVEGRGISPTIEVTNLPHATFMGQDAQLEAAVEHLRKRISEDPVPPLEPQSFTPLGTPAQDVLSE